MENCFWLKKFKQGHTGQFLHPYLTRETRDGEGGDEEHGGPAAEPLSHDAAQHAGRDHCQGWYARCKRKTRMIY